MILSRRRSMRRRDGLRNIFLGERSCPLSRLKQLGIWSSLTVRCTPRLVHSTGLVSRSRRVAGVIRRRVWPFERAHDRVDAGDQRSCGTDGHVVVGPAKPRPLTLSSSRRAGEDQDRSS